MDPLPTITFDALQQRYDVLLFDAYGVLIHSTGPLPGAAERIDALNRRETPYFVLTNDASRLPETAAARYQGFGLAIPPERVITAGSLLGPYFEQHGLAGSRCAVLGPEESTYYVERAGGVLVDAHEPFDVLVVADERGFPFLQTVDAVVSRLYRQTDAGHSPHLLLPNPDLVYPKGAQEFGIASGSIALMLEAALALRYPNRPDLRFVRLGKPHTALFEAAARRANTMNMVMIGDQLETDVRGARAFGIDAVLVRGGITGQDVWLSADSPQPTWIMSGL